MATYDELDIEVKTHGSRSQKVRCPVCSHTRKNKADKCLSVNLEKGLYNCHNCGWGGIVDGITEQDKKQAWAQQKKEYAKPPEIELPLGEKTIAWFKGRGITPETLQYFRVSESQEWMPQKGDHKPGNRNCINFNYFRDKQKVNVKYRDALKSFKMTKDAELILYNLDALQGRKDMLICEGEIDCMSFYQAGHYGAVSVPNGASKGNARLEYIDNCADSLIGMEKIIIAVDSDEAGTFLKNELVRRLGKHRCWFVSYPDDCKDANEVLLKHGVDAVRKLYQAASCPPLESVLTVDDLYDDLDEIYLNGWPSPEPIGYEDFDHLLNFAPGEVTTVTGIPGHGKDEFITQILVRKAARYGHRCAVFNYEEPAKIIFIKAAQKYIGKPFHRKDELAMMSLAERDAAYKFLNEHLFVIDNQTADLTIDGLIAKATELVLRKGVKYVAFGPYNCIEHRRGDNQSEGEYISWIYQKLTRFALAYGVHVFFVAHPTKVQKDKKTKQFEVPTLYMISGSANFFNKTHNGLCIYRNYADNSTDVYVQKVKFFFNGRLGYVTFKFDPHTGRYQESGLDYESEVNNRKPIYESVQLEITPEPSPPKQTKPAGDTSEPTSPPIPRKFPEVSNTFEELEEAPF